MKIIKPERTSLLQNAVSFASYLLTPFFIMYIYIKSISQFRQPLSIRLDRVPLPGHSSRRWELLRDEYSGDKKSHQHFKNVSRLLEFVIYTIYTFPDEKVPIGK